MSFSSHSEFITSAAIALAVAGIFLGAVAATALFFIPA